MDSKVIIAIVVVAALVIGGGVALVMMGSSDNGKKDVVTYYGNGGTYEGDTKMSSPSTTVMMNVFKNGDKAFTTWNTQSDGKGKDYQEGDTVTLGTKLYAQWSNYKLTIERLDYIGYGLSLYLTDDTHTMDKLSKFTVPLSDKGMAILTYAQWDEVHVECNKFVGTANGYSNIAITINMTGADSVELKVSPDGKMAMVEFTYHGNVVLK